MGFLFDTSKGETPETIKRQRDIIRALMGASRAPQNVGEGLNALGDGIVANALGRRADSAEKAGLESADAAMGPLAAMFGGGAGGTPTSASAAAPGAAPSPYAGMADGPKGQENYAAAGGDIEAYIRKAASARGYDPEAVMRVVMGEGGVKEGALRSRGHDPAVGGQEQSYGPFQLNMHAGLGKRLLEEHGIDARDPANVYKGIDYALDRAGVEGWTPWLNTQNKLGYDKWTGLKRGSPGAAPAPTQVASLDPAAGLPAEAAQQPPAQGGAPGPELIKALAEQGIPADGPQAQAYASIGAGGSVPEAQQQIVKALAQPAQQAPMQVAQADIGMGGGQGGGAFPAAPGSSEGKIQQLLAAAQNPYLSESQQAIVKALLGEEMQKRDPAYKMGLEKSQLELDALRNPKMSPGDAAQLDFGKQKFEAEQKAAAAKAAQEAEKLKFDQGDTTADNARADKEFEQKQKEAGLTSDIKEYNIYARDEVNAGRVPLGRLQYSQELKKAGASSTNVSVDSGMKLTEGQSKDIGYFARGLAANDALSEREQELTSLAGSVAGNFGVPGNYYKDPKYRQAERDGREVLAVLLRKDTGAVITDDEFKQYGQIYLPWPGDDAATVADKHAARERALRGIELGLGTAEPLAKAVREKYAAEKEAKKRQAPAAAPKPVTEMSDEELQAIINGQ